MCIRDSPNIVRVHEFDRDGGVAFFTMELLSGALLSRVLNARGAVALPRPEALAVIRDIGAALVHAHSRGVVHGDVNPQNIFITNEGDLRVLDFGAALHVPLDPQGAGAVSYTHLDVYKRQVGVSWSSKNCANSAPSAAALGIWRCLIQFHRDWRCV